MSKSEVEEEEELDDPETAAEDAEEESAEEGPVDEVEGGGEDAESVAEMYKDRWVRLAAEFDNYKKRTLRERETLIRSANESLIRDLLPVVDSVDRANAHADGDTDSEAFKEGIRMIMEEMPKILESRGLKEIEAAGLPFDPNLHEALMQVESDHEAGTVAGVIERGYCLADRVLRHAKVVVSAGSADVSQGSADVSQGSADEDSADANKQSGEADSDEEKA